MVDVIEGAEFPEKAVSRGRGMYELPEDIGEKIIATLKHAKENYGKDFFALKKEDALRLFGYRGKRDVGIKGLPNTLKNLLNSDSNAVKALPKGKMYHCGQHGQTHIIFTLWDKEEVK